MSEHDEQASALNKDNPPVDEESANKGLGSESGAEGGPGDDDQDVTKLMPEARGPVVYPDKEDFSEERPTSAPQEGRVEEDPDAADDASSGAKD